MPYPLKLPQAVPVGQLDQRLINKYTPRKEKFSWLFIARHYLNLHIRFLVVSTFQVSLLASLIMVAISYIEVRLVGIASSLSEQESNYDIRLTT